MQHPPQTVDKGETYVLCHCEERSDVAIRNSHPCYLNISKGTKERIATTSLQTGLAMTVFGGLPTPCGHQAFGLGGLCFRKGIVHCAAGRRFITAIEHSTRRMPRIFTGLRA